jgi:hypothetical protein
MLSQLNPARPSWTHPFVPKAQIWLSAQAQIIHQILKYFTFSSKPGSSSRRRVQEKKHSSCMLSQLNNTRPSWTHPFGTGSSNLIVNSSTSLARHLDGWFGKKTLNLYDEPAKPCKAQLNPPFGTESSNLTLSLSTNWSSHFKIFHLQLQAWLVM